ncbi:MAG: hypothetical protein ACXVPE_02745 [Bacteroidia bacterium]
MRTFFLCSCLFILASAFSQSCECDESKNAFSQQYISSHGLIFRGKTVSIAEGEDFNKVTFVITQLFKGSCPKEIDVYFDKKGKCQLKFNTGEDWIIYANFKQMQKPYVEYCSRSRKNVIITNKNVEVQYAKTDLTVDAECEKLREQTGIQNFTSQAKEENNLHSNIIPGFWQRVGLILCSAAGFVLIYFGANKLMKK